MTRPGLRNFYNTVKDLFDVYFFTVSEKKYADQIIDFIDDQIPQERRFYKSDCISFHGYYVKDLSILRRNLNDIILVDDTKGSALIQPQNLLLVKPWLGCLNSVDSKTDNKQLNIFPNLNKERRKSENDVTRNKKDSDFEFNIDNELNDHVLPILIDFAKKFHRHNHPIRKCASFS